jgi:DHA1 family tetracycline resistance protein-like MFS transporter
MSTTLRRLFPLLLVIFLDSFSFFIVIPILLQIFYQTDYGLLPSDSSFMLRSIVTGMTISLSKLAGLIAAPFIGSLSDKFGRKTTLLLCMCAITIGFLLPIVGILQQQLWLILLGRCFSGVGAASQPIAQAAVADLCAGKEKAYFLSLIAFMMTLSIIVGPLAGGYLSDNHLVSWFTINTPMWCAFVLSVFTFFTILFFFNETMSLHTARNEMVSVCETVAYFRRMIKQQQIGLLFLIFFCLELGWSQYYQSIFLYLHQTANYSTQQISLFNAYMGVLMSLGLLFLYPMLIRFYSVYAIMRASIICVLVGFISIVFFPTANMQWVYVPLVAIFTGIAYVSLLSLISNRTADADQGKTMGYASTLLFSAWMLTAFNGGWLISLHTLLPLYMSALFLVMASTGLYFMRHETRLEVSVCKQN